MSYFFREGLGDGDGVGKGEGEREGEGKCFFFFFFFLLLRILTILARIFFFPCSEDAEPCIPAEGIYNATVF